MQNIFDPEKLDKVCRICYAIKDEIYSLFTNYSLYDNLVKYAKLNVHINDGGPSSICSQCLSELNIFIEFLDKCKRANEIFIQHKENFSDTSRVENSNECASYNVNGKNADNIYNNEDCNQRTVQDIDNEQLKLTISKPASHTCQLCCKVFTRKFNYKLHLKRHSGERGWACRVCGAALLTRAAALRHCEPQTRRACPVPDCGKTFTSVTNLNTHIRKHNGERPYSCADCGKTFGSKNTLSDHVRIHTGVKPYMCWLCGKQFATNKLSAHLRTHAARAHPCSLCPRRLSSARALRLHARTHAPPARAHQCTACPARYSHKQSLNKHLRNRHGLKTS